MTQAKLYLRQVEACRIRQGLTQQQLAERSGLSLRTVQRLLSGSSAPEPSLRVLQALADATGHKMLLVLVASE